MTKLLLPLTRLRAAVLIATVLFSVFLAVPAEAQRATPRPVPHPEYTGSKYRPVPYGGGSRSWTNPFILIFLGLAALGGIAKLVSLVMPKTAESHIKTAIDMYEIGNFHGALAAYDQALQLDPKNAVAYKGRADTKRNLGAMDEAIADYLKALELQPDSAPTHNNLGNAQSDKGDYQGAIASFDKALSIDPTLSVAYENRGNAKEKLGDLESSLADYAKAVEIAPQDAGAHNSLGCAKLHRGDLEGARASLDTALKLEPKQAGYWVNRAAVKKASGDLAGAIDDYTQALQHSPANDSIHLERIFSAYRLGDMDRALEFVSSATSHYARDPYLHFLAWMIRVKRGETSVANMAIKVFQLSHAAKSADGFLDPFAKPSGNLEAWEQFFSAEKTTPFYRTILSFLCGNQTEAEFLASVTPEGQTPNNGKVCEAHCFVGFHRLASNDKAGAAEHFRQSVATGAKEIMCHQIAAKELKELEA